MPEIIRHPLSLSIPDAQLNLTQLVYGNGAPVVYIQAGIHANEYPAMACAAALRDRLAAFESEGRITGTVRLVPVANPIGLGQFVQAHHQGRYDADTGVNFNRGYPSVYASLKSRVESELGADVDRNETLIRGALTAIARELNAETLSQQHKHQLFAWALDADYLIDLHCDEQALMHLYASKRAYPQLRPLAQALGVRVAMLADDSGGASFDEAGPGLWSRLAADFPDLPIPVGCRGCTVECRGELDVSEAHANADAEGIVRYLGQIGVLRGTAEIDPFDVIEVDLEAVDLLPTPSAGLIEWSVAIGDTVKAGDTVAHVTPLDPVARAPVPIVARNAGLVMTTITRRYVRAGQSVCKIAGSEPLTWRSGYLLGD